MRRFVPFVLIGLSAAASPLPAAPGGSGGETTQPEARPSEPPTAGTVLAQEEPIAPELRLDRVHVEESRVADDAEAAQWPQRGSFWWLVGVIVVAGVILAVLL
jgi:hypothetical protein